jgi:hypothetical protein
MCEKLLTLPTVKLIRLGLIHGSLEEFTAGFWSVVAGSYSIIELSVAIAEYHECLKERNNK